MVGRARECHLVDRFVDCHNKGLVQVDILARSPLGTLPTWLLCVPSSANFFTFYALGVYFFNVNLLDLFQYAV